MLSYTCWLGFCVHLALPTVLSPFQHNSCSPQHSSSRHGAHSVTLDRSGPDVPFSARLKPPAQRHNIRAKASPSCLALPHFLRRDCRLTAGQRERVSETHDLPRLYLENQAQPEEKAEKDSLSLLPLPSWDTRCGSARTATAATNPGPPLVPCSTRSSGLVTVSIPRLGVAAPAGSGGPSMGRVAILTGSWLGRGCL